MAMQSADASRTEPEDEEPGDAHAVRARLAALLDQAGAAYAAVTAADAGLRVIAPRRVAAERALRRALAARQAARAAVTAHARARPGPLARLRHPLLAGPDWRRRRAALAAALAETEPPLAAARHAAGTVRDEFAAQVRVRGEEAAALRRLTAACASARADLAGCAAGRELAACRRHAAPPPAAGDEPDPGRLAR
jgi:hypothetical protein